MKHFYQNIRVEFIKWWIRNSFILNSKIFNTMLSVLGGFLLISLFQLFQYKYETKFNARLSIIIKNRQEVFEIYQHFDEIMRTIRSQESLLEKKKNLGDRLSEPIIKGANDNLRRIGIDILLLKESALYIVPDTSELFESINILDSLNTQFRKCLNSSEEINCSQTYGDEIKMQIKKIIHFYNKNTNESMK